jgi:DNA replication initiation complex subunit (GINS family)
MSENALTFSELRKIQKEEKREEDLTELEDDFFLRVSNYLRSKKETSGEGREYKNARRVFDKIISLREDKIVKNAKISVKTEDLSSADLMLPREKELYRQLKEVFNDHRSRVDEIVDSEEGSTDTAELNTEEQPADDTETEKQASSEETKPEPMDEIEEEPEEDSGEEEQTESKTEESEETSEAEEGYTYVKIVSEVPEFMGTDLETYGPFEEGDEAEIPDDNAEILVNRGNAEEM